MLGAPCNPCCGPPECGDEQIAAVFSAIAQSTCSVQIPAGLPYQDAATLCSPAFAYQVAGETGESLLRRNLGFSYYRQHQSASGSHDLALDVAASQTYEQNGALAGQVWFRKSTDSYDIEVIFAVNTVYVMAVGSPFHFYRFPGSQCVFMAAGRLRIYRDSATSGGDPVNGISLFTRPYVETQNGQVVQSYTNNAALANATYYQILRRGSSTLGRDAFTLEDNGQYASLRGWWPVDHKPSVLPWSRSTSAEYRWNGASDLAQESSQLAIASGAFNSFISGGASRWKPYFAAISPEWLSDVDFASSLVLSQGLVMFRAEYSPASTQYINEDSGFSSLAGLSVTLQP